MKVSVLLVIALLLLASCSSASAVAIGVDYDHAGLTQIRIKAGRLHYVWHTLRKHDGPAPLRQDMSSYDRHEVHIWLTGQEADAIVQWMKKRKVFALPKKYPPRKQKKTYSSAFRSTLLVTLEDSKHSIAWTGEDQIPTSLEETVAELKRICDGIRKDREKKE